MPIAGHAPMPCCGPKDQAPILAAVETMPATHRRQARAFVARIGTRGVCELLHSMRRWYANGWNAHVAKRILKHRDAIVRHGAMRLDGAGTLQGKEPHPALDHEVQREAVDALAV